MALHPVGPLPASVYWRRRLVLLVGVVVVLLLLRSCAGGDGGTERLSSGPSPTPSASTALRPSASATARPTTAAAGTCTDGALRVTVRPDAETYAVGASPRFTVTVTNTSAAACRRDLGAGAVELVVSSGTDRIWSSDDCASANGTEVLLLKAGAALEQTVTWSGKRSTKGCPSASPRAEAKAGTYRVVARVGTLRSAPAVFRLRTATGG